MYKKYFCTFADSRMKKSLERVQRQAREMNYFDEIFVNDENDLNPHFKEEFKDKLIKGSRGYGYWVWKPQIILQTLEKMQEGDILLYADVGCHLNKDGVERLNYYFEQANTSEIGLLTFQEALETQDKNLITSYSHLEKKYTKGDIFDYFKVRANKKITDTGIVAATTFIIKKNSRSCTIVEQWLDIFKNNFNLIDDSTSMSPNLEGFIENRHDQSIFSLLCKLNTVPSISAYEIWQEDWKKLKEYPIWAKRDKELNLFWFFKQKILSFFSKITKK